MKRISINHQLHKTIILLTLAFSYFGLTKTQEWTYNTQQTTNNSDINRHHKITTNRNINNNNSKVEITTITLPFNMHFILQTSRFIKKNMQNHFIPFCSNTNHLSSLNKYFKLNCDKILFNVTQYSWMTTIYDSLNYYVYEFTMMMMIMMMTRRDVVPAYLYSSALSYCCVPSMFQ